ncbi:right-handed parallel beta-helix repeat-containing protein [Leptospira langatensis]|uniref:right-handed parallel beta-helix repeat-containing protein n=1 Tax=Leptospira langatensis TaxID=2484983 RepID=UPI001FE9E915|nr:right-handed parallel beta-helix repeat-containing protein [Leptospira langatensis]
MRIKSFITKQALVYRLRFLLLLFLSFFSCSCYKPPPGGGLLDFFNFKTSLDAIDTPVPVFAQVSGLSSGTLTVTNGLGETLTFTSNGAQKFPTLVKYKSAYSVTLSGPVGASVNLTCKISNPNGPILLPQTTIFITCGVVFYDLSVNVIGLDPTVAATDPLILQNMGDRISFNADGTKKFATQVGDGASYSVSLISVPKGHTCSFIPVTSGSGNISGGPLTLTLDCISPLKYIPSTGILAPSSKVSIQLSYHGIDPGSCSFDFITISGKNNAAATASPPSITYPSGTNNNTIVLVPNGPDFWGPSGEGFVQLSGCTGGGLPISNGNPILLNLTVASNIRFVDVNDPSAGDTPGCGVLGDPPCRSIPQGITECDASGLPCSVFVAEGTYPVVSQIFLGNTTSLVGGFPSGFSSLAPDPVNHVTLIQDTRIGCGAVPTDFCIAVSISTVGLNPASTSLTVSGFTIQVNSASYSEGILLNGCKFNSGQIRITQNTILGDLTVPPGSDVNSNGRGIEVAGSENIVISGNTIRGPSRKNSSEGIFLIGSGLSQPIIITGNIIDGMIADSGISAAIDLDFSAAIIANNKINAYQFLNPTPVAVISAGIMIDDAFGGTSYIFNNDIFVPDSQSGMWGPAVGIAANGDIDGSFLILNNQIFSTVAGSTGNTLAILLSEPPAPPFSTILRGNNYFTGTDIVVTGSLVNSNNYNSNPRFKSTTLIDQLWNFTSSSGTSSPTDSPCSSLYGGIDLSTIGLPLAAIPYIGIDFSGNGRTTITNPLTPIGGDGISIGAVESDSNCF